MKRRQKNIGKILSSELKRIKPKAKTKNQQVFIDEIKSNVITFCEGPAGTGKTHLSVGVGIDELFSGFYDKIVLTRPIVEAGGERMGFLPGNAEEKLSPYMRPLFDEIECFLNKTQSIELKENGFLEVAPLALMRGRTFNNSFIIIDECQNATYEQILLLLTRLGTGSKIVLSGDVNQSDLPNHLQGGFSDWLAGLEGLEGVGTVHLTEEDIVRHPMVAKILNRMKNFSTRR